MYKSCSSCGKIHSSTYKCNVGKIYKKNKIDRLRSSYNWLMKAQAIKEASNYLCSVCREEGRYTYNNLEVHHITKLQDEPEKLLDNYNLICLCTEHHKLADKNEIDKDYLLKLAKLREDST